MSDSEDSDAYFEEILHKRLRGDFSYTKSTISREIEPQEDASDIEDRIKEKKEELERRRKELEELKSKKTRASPKLRKSVENLEKENAALKSDLAKGEKTVTAITELFHKLCESGGDFDKFPEIDYFALEQLCGPSEEPERQIKTMDPVVQRIVDRDPYFSGIEDNDSFVERVTQLKDELDQSRSSTCDLMDSVTSMSEELRSSSMTRSSERSSPVRAAIVNESQRTIIEQARFAAELNDLLDIKQSLLDRIIAEKVKIKNREERYKNESLSPSKTVIKLKMYNSNASKSNSESLTRAELSPPASPMK